jgi:hypothetical protein
MLPRFKKSELTLAIIAVISVGAVATSVAQIRAKGTYLAGDFHNHTTCSDGELSMQKLVKYSVERTTNVPWGLDWFVQAGHGGTGNRNCTLAEDESLATPAYPLVTSATNPALVLGPNTTWANSNPSVLRKGTSPGNNMFRWQALQEFQYPMMEYLSAYRNVPMFLGMESVVAGHEHASMGVITGQMPATAFGSSPSNGTPYIPFGDANALAQWSYCFDRGVTDTSRGNQTSTSSTPLTPSAGNNWNCSVTGSANASDPSWNATAAKLIPTGTGVGDKGHIKTVEGMKWMKEFHPNASYYVPAHLERAGPFNPSGNNGFNIEHLRNFNNAAPDVAFGMETQPGHGASDSRGEYARRRNQVGTVRWDTVGGTTYGGTGIYGAQIGGVWDALLGEGRNFWFFASSDWHNRGSFPVEDRRSTQDFLPGEYQRNYTMVRNGTDRLDPQTIVNGLRTGNTFTSSGQLIDRLSFIACASYPGPTARSNAAVEAMALRAAIANESPEGANCASMGEKLTVRPNAEIVVSIVVRDPSGTNYSPYSFPNPSLQQVGITQPLNAPVLHHIDVIGGLVTGYKTPGASDYAGQWPLTWYANPDMNTVPAAAKNTSATIKRVFNNTSWTVDGEYRKMTYRIPAGQASQYLRLRGTNLPPSVPFETDPSGNPLTDQFTNAAPVNNAVVLAPIPPATSQPPEFLEGQFLSIQCNAVGTTQFDGCPSHLFTSAGQKFLSYDVAAWADLWFYSNPIYIQVTGSTVVAGVK